MIRSYLLGVAFLLAVIAANGQDSLEPTGSFGEPIDKKGAVSVKKLAQKMDEAESLDIKVKGTITEVCQAKGCWMTLDLGNDELMRVKFKDYGFFVPKDAVGKTAIIKGVAKNEIVGVDELKHLAEDAGRSEKEINAIDKPKEELTFVAEGVIIK
jgi:hypothetical protein